MQVLKGLSFKYLRNIKKITQPMNARLRKVSLFTLSLLFVLPLLLESCYKAKQKDPKVIITVLDSFTLRPLPGRNVRLQLDTFRTVGTKPRAAVKFSPDTKITDARGEVEFTTPLEASYYADVTDPALPGDTARSLVRFQMDLVNKYSIYY